MGFEGGAGDLGDSLWERRAVTTAIFEKLPATVQLGFTTFLFSVVIGIPLGVLSAVHRGTIVDLDRGAS